MLLLHLLLHLLLLLLHLQLHNFKVLLHRRLSRIRGVESLAARCSRCKQAV